MDRRRLLGTAGALGAGVALTGRPSASARELAAPAAAAHPPAGGADPTDQGFDLAPAQAALRRLLPEGPAAQFQLAALTGPERFRVTGADGAVRVAGTSPAVLLTGVHWYLKYACGAHLSWAGSRWELPDPLPAPASPWERSATVPHRFACNDTHDGYTAPYADWPHWERLIDLLALHGCNEVLVTPGSEAVYHRLLTDFGYTDAEARAWIPAPSHQPWWLLQNLSGYGGPISAGQLARRTELGRRIVDRLRELGMRPVLPGYFGTVPRGFERRNAGAVTVPQGSWHGFSRPAWLDPRTSVFAEVAAAYYRHQRDLFGEIDRFKMDLLHEGGDPGNVPVDQAAREVERALRTAHPQAVWVILGWQSNPRPQLLAGLAEPQRMLIVDGLSDLDRVTDRERDWGGVPYAFGTIPNFGGRTTLGARTHLWSERFTTWRDRPGSALVGTAYLAEAAERDPAAFELFSELAWRQEPVDRAAWFTGYARLRYGADDPAATRAMAALRDTAYQISSRDGRPHDSVFASRPSLQARSGTRYATHQLSYDPAAFDGAFDALLEVAPELRDSDTYRYDLTDLARQALANRSWQLIGHLEDAYARRDRTAFGRLADLWLELMRLSDDMAGCHSGFLLGPWVDEARRAGGDAAEAAEWERTARVLVTTWGDRVTADQGRLVDYANRDWQGLIADVYLPRWQRYLEELRDAMAAGREPADVDWYAAEEAWTRRRNDYPLRPVRDAHTTGTRVREALASAPYQGAATVAVEPAVLYAGGDGGLLTVTFRNVNGLRATGAVDLALTGLDGAEATGGTTLPQVPAGGTGEVSWRVPAPAEVTAPLTPLPYTLAAEYGPQGAQRVRSLWDGAVLAGGPLDPELRTVSTNDARFGQLGRRWAIDGGGVDLWKGTAEFGAVYRAGALRAGGSATVRVVSQAATGPWARAGIIVANTLATAGSGGLVTLAVTPANGVVLSYDSDGDGTLDTYRRVTAVTAPVSLRLTRTAGGFLGELSTDGGGSWRTVATVPVPPGTAAVQDTGLVMSAANGGDGSRGTVEFDGWRLG